MSQTTRPGGSPTAADADEQLPGQGPPTIHEADGGSDEAELVREAPSELRQSRWTPVIAYVLTVFVLVTLNFALPRMMPSNPIDALLAQSSPNYVADDDIRARLAEYYGLDEPVMAQYVDYLANLAQGDVGVSIDTNRPVSEELLNRLPWTFLLLGASILLSLVIGLPAGIHSAWKRGRGVDRGLLGFFLSVQNVPIFFVGAVALLIFGAILGLVPLSGATTPFADYGPVGTVLDVAHHLLLPALLMALSFAAFQYLVMRSATVSELGADYLLGGRAKGLSERRLKYRYAGRNALLPVVTVVGLQFGQAVTAAIFVEQIFAYPGVGLYMFNAVFDRDYPAMQGAFLVLTLVVVTFNLLADLTYRHLDPRTTA